MPKDFRKILKEFVSTQSISTDLSYQTEVVRAARFIASYLSKSGLKVKIIKGFENPIIIAQTREIKNTKTILVYGHYDVQPADTDFFHLKQKKGRLYGRGIADNKGQILIHMYSVINLLKESKLKYNVIFLIEGNEETGSSKLAQFVEKNKKLLKADCILISDSEFASGNKPALEASCRGAANFEVVLTTGLSDLHSGLFGGVVPNAAEELGKIIGSITEFTGSKVGFIPNTERYEKRRGLEQTVEVTGFISGYTDEGFKNIIPCRAMAKLNVRSTPTSDPRVLRKKVQKFILKKAPKHVNVQFKDRESALGIKVYLNNKFAKRAGGIIESIYNIKPIAKNGGGTLPIANTFKKILRAPQVMVPLANENCGAHSASENMTIYAIKKGLLFSSRFFSK